MTMDRRHMLLSSLSIGVLGLTGCTTSSSDRVPLLSVVRVGKVEVKGAKLLRLREASKLKYSDEQIRNDLERAINARISGLGSGPGRVDLTLTLKAVRIAEPIDAFLSPNQRSGFEVDVEGSGQSEGRNIYISGKVNAARKDRPGRDVETEYRRALAESANALKALLEEETV